jgi:ribose transport system ATP-binding protein
VSSESKPSLLEVDQVCKRFAGVQALRGVSLVLERGEVLAVLGENGAGKSTLMKILAGVQQADSGSIRMQGAAVELDSCRTAMAHGIVLIHQELNLADNLDIGANIFLGREPRKFGFIDRQQIEAQSRRYLQMVGLDESPRKLVSELTIGQQQLVEIAKALSANAQVLIMDEPTSSLSAGETKRLFEVVKDLRCRGVSVIYISHRLGEVKELADRVTVLRDGQNAGDLNRQQISHDNMVRLMVGRDVSQIFNRQATPAGETMLKVTGLVTPCWPQHRVSFEVKAGEIVGVAGLVGAGRTEVLRCLFGIDRPLAGQIDVSGRAVRIEKPQDAIREGIGLIPEDRKQEGLVLEMPVSANVGLPGLRRNSFACGFLNQKCEDAAAASMIAKMRIRTPSAAQIVQFLSGGNQQKVVIGKWLALEPRVLLLDEPTRGIDVGAKQEIYRLMEELAAQGMALLFVSSEMEEILGMSDRVLVMHEGRITGQLLRSELTEEAVMFLATGRESVTVSAGS